MNDIVNIPIEKINKIFPSVKSNFLDDNKIDKTKLKISKIGLYSVSGVNSSNKLIYLIKKYFKTDKITITDMTGNNGSDTINFGLNFKYVNSIEIDKLEYDILKNNVDVYNLKNVNLYNDDSLKIISKLTQDVIYADAPWGGKDYKKNKNLKLYMSGKEISQIYNENKQYCKLFVFKVPINYDFNYFIKETKNPIYYIHSYVNHKNEIKFYFIFLQHYK